MGIHFGMDDEYTGHGASGGLSRGLLVYHDGKNIVSEGMGIGAVALRNGRTTYFSDSGTTETLDSGRFRKRFVFDKRITWSMRSVGSRILTAAIEGISDAYMSNKALRKTILNPALGELARRFLGLAPRFVSVNPRGEAVMEYSPGPQGVAVKCEVRIWNGISNKIYVMNEASADFFDSGFSCGRVIPPPTGWEELLPGKPGISLFSTRARIGFKLANVRLDRSACPNIRIFCGREKTRDLGWAGFALEIKQPNTAGSRIGLEYEARFQDKD